MSSIQNFNYLTPEEEEEACLYAMQLCSAVNLPMVLKAAIELDVFEIIAKFGHGDYITPSDIASRISTNNTNAPIMLDRMLRLLASHKMLKCSLRNLDDGRVERLYGLVPVCKFFIRNEDGVSLAPLALMAMSQVFIQSWYYLKDAIVDGGSPFNICHGMASFDYIRRDPITSKLFNTGMSVHSKLVMKMILQIYKGFEGLKTVVDVGGGIGAAINMIVEKHPLVKGINFDLPHVIKDAPAYLGVEHIEGDMFVGVPKGDSIFLKSVLHDWNDEHCLKVLKNCYNALPANGKMIILDSIIPVYPETNVAAKHVFGLDTAMMVHTSGGGQERTEKEFKDLSLGAGFADYKVICSTFGISVIEFYKKA